MYEKMKKLMKLLFKDDDLMTQETLFKLQNQFALLMLEVAGKERKVDDLIATFPYIYQSREVVK